MNKKLILPQCLPKLILMLILTAGLFAFTTLSGAAMPEIHRLGAHTLSEYGPEELPATVSESIMIIEKNSGISIYEKNTGMAAYPASLTKIMTAILAYEAIPDKTTPITVTRSVVNESVGTKLGLRKGDIYTAEDLLRALLMSGANDAANLLADYVSGEDREKFIGMMNAKAKEIGCTATRFTNTTGIHDENMVTTVSDMMKIAQYAYEIKDLVDWSSVATYSFSPVNDPDNYIFKYNRNNFVSRAATSADYYKNSYGLSSGSTPEAGNTFVTSAQKNGVTYIVVIMNSPYEDKTNVNHAYDDARLLLDYCFANFAYADVLAVDSPVSELPLKLSSESDHIALYPATNVTALLPVNFNEYTDITLEKIISDEYCYAPVSAGAEFGSMIVRYKDSYILGKTKLVCRETFERSGVLFVIDRIESVLTSKFFIVTAVSAFVMLIGYTFYTMKKRRKASYARFRK